jgi:hypothetical protein
VQEVKSNRTSPSEPNSQWAYKKRKVQGKQTAVTLYDRREYGPIEKWKSEDKLIERREFPRTQHVEKLIDARGTLFRGARHV